MSDKFEQKQERYFELEKLLADPQIISDQKQCQKLAKEYSDLTEFVQLYRQYITCLKHEGDLKKILEEESDKELIELARTELPELAKKRIFLLSEIDRALTPKKEEKNRALIFEIRAGTGGEEASLFAADLYRMYSRYAESKGWKTEAIDSHASESKGFKEVVFGVSGIGAEKHLQFESGAHRVQRVPATETSGRIHTSAATVAVMMEPEEVDIQINPSDLRIDIFRSSGPGGQSVNTTDSAVRITHLPTGTVVTCQDERSQLKNKAKAMRVLRARIMEKIQQDNSAKTSQERKMKVGSGDRSEKIRTYNYPDRRITDHRIGFTTHKFEAVLNGDMDELTNALIKAAEEESRES